MKNNFIILFILSLFSFAKIQSQTVYQVMSVESDNVKNEQDGFFYEDSDIIIDYNFWKEPGVASFNIYNKTDSDIFIDWSKCHFVNNNQSFDYWTDNKVKDTLNVADSAKNKPGLKNSNISKNVKDSLNNDSIENLKIFVIFPKDYLQSSFDLNSTIYDGPDFPFYAPSGKNVREYDLNSSKMRYSYYNYITFSKDSLFYSPRTVCNKFWVTRIMNMKEKRFKGDHVTKISEENNNKTTYEDYSYPFMAPNRFYMDVKEPEDNTGCTVISAISVILLLLLGAY